MIDIHDINVRMECSRTVSERQHLAEDILRDPRLSRRDRRELIRYVRDRPDLFVPYDEINGPPWENDIAMLRNGPDARYDFRNWVELKYSS